MEDPYVILGVARDASQDDIRRAYLALAKAHHPDLNPGDAKAEDRFKAMAAANGLLSDVEKRGRFDRSEIDPSGQERPTRPSYRDHAETARGRRYSHAGDPAGGAFDDGEGMGGGWSAEDFSGLFGSIFNTDRQKAGRSGQRRGRDERYALEIAFLEAVNGATRRLTLPDGRTLDVRIAPGTDDGAVLRLRGQGGEGRDGGGAGDALIAVTVAPHPFFTRDGPTIRLDVPVTLREAALGASISVPTPGGPVRMRVPPHSDNGAEFRLRGRGVPATGGDGAEGVAGDLFATLRLTLGTEPDAALDAFLRDWTPERPANPRRMMEEPA